MKQMLLLLAALALVIVPATAFGQSNPLHNYTNPLDVDANLKVQIARRLADHSRDRSIANGR